MKLGIEYSTHIRASTIEDIIRDTADDNNYVLTKYREDDINISLTMRIMSFRDHLHAIAKRIPTKVSWNIEKNTNGTTILYSDSKITGIYLYVLLISSLICALSYLFGIYILTSQYDTASILQISTAGILIIFSLLLIFLNVSLVIGGGVDRLPIIDNLRLFAINSGSFLVETKFRISPRHALRLIVYMFFTICLLITPIIRTSGNTLKNIPIEFLSIIVIIIALAFSLLVILFLLLRHQSISLRLLPGLAGLCFALAFMLFSLTILPWKINDKTIAITNIESIETSVKLLNENIQDFPYTLPNGNTINQDSLFHFVQKLKIWAWASWIFSLILILGAIGFTFNASYIAIKGLPMLKQMNKRPEISWSEKATRESSYIKQFRLAFASVWFLLFLIIIFCIHSVMMFTGYFFDGTNLNLNNEMLNSYHVSIIFSNLILGSTLYDPIVSFFVRSFWFLFLLIFWVLFLSSITSFFIQKSFTFKYSNPRINNNITYDIQKRIEHLWRNTSNYDAPIVRLFENPSPQAYAHRIKIIKHKKIIDISTGLLKILNDDELDAVLAHELSHHLNHQCLLDDILRFLGRLSLVGDGFVRILEDTFGYELSADKTAVLKFGINPSTLKLALQKVRSLAAAEQLKWLHSEFQFQNEKSNIDFGNNNKTYDNFHLKDRLKFGVLTFFKQYLGIRHSGYWYPSIDLRLKMLDQYFYDKY